MATKSQHAARYQHLPPLLRALREEAGLTQRDLAGRLGKPQSWVYNGESANRRVDATEFIAWAEACEADPGGAFDRLLAATRETVPGLGSIPPEGVSTPNGRGGPDGDAGDSKLGH